MALTRTFAAGREQCFQQVDKLINSHSLRGSESLCKLLRYLAEHSLDHPGVALKEYQIATEVLGRPAGFDPQSDSTVRVQAGRLRVKLAEYYSHEGPDDPILVELPKGSYALTFHLRPAKAGFPSGSTLTLESGRKDKPDTTKRNWAIAVLVLSVLLTASVVTIAALLARTRTQAASSPTPPAVYQIFWSRFVAAPQPPWVIFSNATFVGRPQTNMGYFNPSTAPPSPVLGHSTGVGEVLAIHELHRLFGLLTPHLRLKRGPLLSLHH